MWFCGPEILSKAVFRSFIYLFIHLFGGLKSWLQALQSFSTLKLDFQILFCLQIQPLHQSLPVQLHIWIPLPVSPLPTFPHSNTPGWDFKSVKTFQVWKCKDYNGFVPLVSLSVPGILPESTVTPASISAALRAHLHCSSLLMLSILQPPQQSRFFGKFIHSIQISLNLVCSLFSWRDGKGLILQILTLFPRPNL